MGKETNIRTLFLKKNPQGKELNYILMYILTSTQGDPSAPLFRILIKNKMKF